MPTFLDEVEIEVIAGKGGNGSVSFRREAFVPHGGPNGGDGGRGGDVVIVADENMTTLLDYRYKSKYQAEHGGIGMGGDKNGKNGETLRLKVPPGTVVIDVEMGERVADLIFPGQEYRLAKGGAGGYGNVHFKSSSRQAPRFAQNGEPGGTRKIKLELKLIADVGIIGYPNAGKSTLISQVSAAKPKVADYPFTTLEPNLGVVRAGDRTYTMADMPGLIEGAHQGIGLGDRFLKHIERTRALVHLIDMSPMQILDPIQAFDNINNELEQFDEALMKKPMVVGLNKIDTLAGHGLLDETKEELEKRGYKVFSISAATGQGVEPLKFYVSDLIAALPKTYDLPEEVTVLSPQLKDSKAWKVHLIEANIFGIDGKAVERMVAMTDMHNDEALQYLHRRLQKMGIIDALRDLGCEEGDTVKIGDVEFEFVEGG